MLGINKNDAFKARNFAGPLQPQKTAIDDPLNSSDHRHLTAPANVGAEWAAATETRGSATVGGCMELLLGVAVVVVSAHPPWREIWGRGRFGVGPHY